MTMTLDDILEHSGVMLGAGKLPTTDQLVAWREAIALHLAGMGEPVACRWKSRSTTRKYQWVYAAFGSASTPPSGAESLYTAPPIDLAAVCEVIAEMRDSKYFDRNGWIQDWADKLEAAIKGASHG
ncbi:MAG TPA: hypothetical protein VN731_06790 [Rhodanobacter sp.]|nr:hypothetical protein [Rhodanobacter sp.]